MNLIGDRTEKWDWIPILGYLCTGGWHSGTASQNIQVGGLAQRKLPQVWIIVWICVCRALQWPAIPPGVYSQHMFPNEYKQVTHRLTCRHYGMVFHSGIRRDCHFLHSHVSFLNISCDCKAKYNPKWRKREKRKCSSVISFFLFCTTGWLRVRNSCVRPQMCYIQTDILNNITERWKFYSRINTEDPRISV